MAMRRRRKHHSPRFRSAALLVTGVLIGLLLITPAGAHISNSVNHLFNTHIKPKLANPGTINDGSNPVDWTKLKGVPADFADGVDDTGGPPGPASDVACTNCVTSSDFGTITVRTSSAFVTGGTGENGAYVLDTVSRYCLAGEDAISWSAFWDGDLNGPAEGGGDDQELTIASVEFDINASGNQGYIFWGGNDSGTDHTLTVQVRCLAA